MRKFILQLLIWLSYNLFTCIVRSQVVHDISTFGAKPNGDATQGFQAAFTQACGSAQPTKVKVPGGDFTMGPVTFKGPCKAPVTFEIGGNFKAPPGLESFKGINTWVMFDGINDLTVATLPGGGSFDGQGQSSWKKNDCSSQGTCDTLPYNFRFHNIKKGKVSGITTINPKLYHIGVLTCDDLRFDHLTITAPEDSTNTDGIHIGRSKGIYVLDSKIGTGDDCVSMGDGAVDLHIERTTCGPGHGFSIGSIGKYPNEAPCTGIYFKDCTLTNTMNGVRIKSWLGSTVAEVADVHFEGITMDKVSNPILIDQEYCPWNQCKDKSPSKVKISNVSFKGIKGSSATPEVMKLFCSANNPCTGITISDINLTSATGKAVSQCKNVKPTITGVNSPPPCADAPTPVSPGS